MFVYLASSGRLYFTTSPWKADVEQSLLLQATYIAIDIGGPTTKIDLAIYKYVLDSPQNRNFAIYISVCVWICRPFDWWFGPLDMRTPTFIKLDWNGPPKRPSLHQLHPPCLPYHLHLDAWMHLEDQHEPPQEIPTKTRSTKRFQKANRVRQTSWQFPSQWWHGFEKPRTLRSTSTVQLTNCRRKDFSESKSLLDACYCK